jgi:hypothetical protein
MPPIVARLLRATVILACAPCLILLAIAILVGLGLQWLFCVPACDRHS